MPPTTRSRPMSLIKSDKRDAESHAEELIYAVKTAQLLPTSVSWGCQRPPEHEEKQTDHRGMLAIRLDAKGPLKEGRAIPIPIIGLIHPYTS